MKYELVENYITVIVGDNRTTYANTALDRELLLELYPELYEIAVSSWGDDLLAEPEFLFVPPSEEEQKREQTTLAIKLLIPSLPDENILQIPLLFDEWSGDGRKYTAQVDVVRVRENDEDLLYRVITTHNSQMDWSPGITTSALFKRIAPPGVIEPWRQPQGAHDAYQIGNKVTHKDKTWISTAKDNIWEPGVYGWDLTE